MKNTIFIILIYTLCISCSVKRSKSHSLYNQDMQSSRQESSDLTRVKQSEDSSLTLAQIQETEYKVDSLGNIKSVLLRKIDFVRKDTTIIIDSSIQSTHTKVESDTETYIEEKTEQSIKPSFASMMLKVGLGCIMTLAIILGLKILKRYIGL